jgi:hypothetical protein
MRKPDKIHEYKKKPNGKNDTGRPQIWTLEYTLNELNEWNNLILEEDARAEEAHLNRQKYNRRFIFIKQLCHSRGYAYDTFWNQTMEYHSLEEFAHLYKKINERFESGLAMMSLNKQYSTAGAIFLLKNYHGFKDNIDIDMTSKGEKFNGFKIEIVNAKDNQSNASI